jgi:hypothetical protein
MKVSASETRAAPLGKSHQTTKSFNTRSQELMLHNAAVICLITKKSALLLFLSSKLSE